MTFKNNNWSILLKFRKSQWEFPLKFPFGIPIRNSLSEFPFRINKNSRKNIIVDNCLIIITCVKSLTLLKEVLIRSLCVLLLPKKVIFDPKRYFFKKIKKNRGHWNCNKKIFGGVTLNLFFFFKMEKKIRGRQNSKKKFFSGRYAKQDIFFSLRTKMK